MIGRTDEPLCDEGIREAGERIVPRADLWIVSPMKRCVQTARILREKASDPSAPCMMENDFRECDFGHFEDRNYIEMTGDEEYQAWISSGGRMPFPGGEDPALFQERCCRAFSRILAACALSPEDGAGEAEKIAALRLKNGDPFVVNMVVHGGTIMSIMDRYAVYEDGRKKTYYEWAVPNLGGYTLRADEPLPPGGGLLTVIREYQPAPAGTRKDTE